MSANPLRPIDSETLSHRKKVRLYSEFIKLRIKPMVFFRRDKAQLKRNGCQIEGDWDALRTSSTSVQSSRFTL